MQAGYFRKDLRSGLKGRETMNTDYEFDTETLQAARDLPVDDFREGAAFLLDHFDSTGIGSGKLADGMLELHTGGWSECEALICAAEESTWWLRYWYSTTRGGHYVFRR